jgi:hypothetical protein
VIAKGVPIDPRLRSVVMFADTCGATPGTRVASWAKVRPLSGRSLIALASIVVATPVVSVWRAIAEAETSIASSKAPSCKRMSTRTVWAARSTRLVTEARKPEPSALMVYVPCTRYGRE